MKVYKFGGTSVGKPERMMQVAQLITKDDEPKIVVLSAVSGTTNTLVQINDALFQNNKVEAAKIIDDLYKKYELFIQDFYKNTDVLAKAKAVIDKQFAVIKEQLHVAFTSKEERLMLAQGELISTQLFHLYLQENNIGSELLWALDFMSIDQDFEPEIDVISTKLKAIVASKPSVKLFITQGYICMNADGEVDNLKRGGSDYTASLVGAAIDAEEVQIWTDIDGMHNNDPRIVKKTFPIHQLNFDEAAELAYFGAKILHPSTIRPAQVKGIPVMLLNTMQPEAKGTVIAATTGDAPIKAVAAKDNITAVKIKSTRMLLAYGFLRKVFEVFEKYKTPIDMITTSEIAVSLTIDTDVNLKAIIQELEKFGIVEVDRDQSIICVVGAFLTEKNGVLQKVLNSLDTIPMRMVSYGGSKNNISILIATKDKNTALSLLNKGCFGLE